MGKQNKARHKKVAQGFRVGHNSILKKGVDGCLQL